ncbi:hypothetical protein ACN1NW_000453 [Acinetobacter baumannii]|nr:hypothetical protein [Acinetobacter baumannii]ELA7031037.1 hypothetical protein [Acinetobacter baumannii]ELA7118800.1 hypothetical protein [Acinetobacter baumannii]ELB0919749.1 hypothetical protein [Acinetobacter baumannii]ELB0965926.1 hypothetical protein [Acinetobacter baumannii]
MIVYIRSKADKCGLICTAKDENFDIDCFDFYVHNGAWSGTFCDGQIEVHYSGLIADDQYATIDETQFPEWAEKYTKGIKERENRRNLRDENPLELYDDSPF